MCRRIYRRSVRDEKREKRKEKERAVVEEPTAVRRAIAAQSNYGHVAAADVIVVARK